VQVQERREQVAGIAIEVLNRHVLVDTGLCRAAERAFFFRGECERKSVRRFASRPQTVEESSGSTHGRVDALLGDRPAEHHRGVQVRETRVAGGRVGEVVGGRVDRLHRGDRDNS